MEGLESQINPEVWAQIQEQFEKLQNKSMKIIKKN